MERGKKLNGTYTLIDETVPAEAVSCTGRTTNG